MMDQHNYIKLAQLEAARPEYFGPASALLEKTLKDDSIINYQIPATEYLKSKESELIGCTPLHIVVQDNKIDYLINLIDRGADFTIKNDAGQTALHKIIERTENRSKKCWILKGKLKHSRASLILSAHAKINNYSNPCDNIGLSHFHIACMINHTEAIEFFVKSGVHINEPVHFNSPYLPGYTPLHIAARYSCYEASNLLLKHNADINLRNSEGISSLHLLLERNMEIMDYVYMSKRAAYDYFKEEYDTNEKMIRLFIENNETADWNAVDDISLSLFQVMCTFQDTSVVDKLLKGNINLKQCIRMDSPVWPGYTALHFAAHFNFKTVRLLLKHGADIRSVDAKGNTPFDLCLKRFKLEDTFLLFMSQPDWEDIRFSNNEMRLADLVYAMRDQHLLSTVLRKLFKNVNACIPYDSPLWSGFTPLHVAVVLSDKIYDIANLYESTDYNVKISSKNYYNCDQADNKLCRQRIKVCLDLECDVTSKDSHGSTPIHLAFPLMSSSTINWLLDSQRKIFNPSDKNGLSHLHIACATNNFEFVERLLSKKVDVNGQVTSSFEFKGTAESQPLLISKGSTPLHIAVSTNQIRLIRLLLKHEADRNAHDDNGLTPIHLVLKIKHSSQKEVGVGLLSSDSLKDLETSFGLNYLHVASCIDDTKAIERLLVVGANIEATIKLKSPNNCCITNNSSKALSFLDRYNGCTPLDVAMERKNIKAATILLKRGANILAKKLGGAAPYSDALEVNSYVQKIIVQTVQEDASFQKRILEAVGLSLLHVACATLDVDRADELLRNGADPNARLHADSPFWPGFTPLHCALTGSDGDKIMQIAQSLFDHGADVKLTDQSGETPIHQLFHRADYSLEGNELFEFLLKHQEDYSVNPTDLGGVSHFHIACMCKDRTIIEAFLRHNVNVNLMIDHFNSAYGGSTPLHVALWNSSSDIADLLLNHGANVHLGNDLSNTPLHYAARFSHDLEGCFDALISAGADVNATTVLGETPFEKLAEAPATEGDIALFIEQGCCINSYNPSTQEGLIGKSISEELGTRVTKNPFYQTLIKNPDVNDFDELGRTPLHNIASSSGLVCTADGGFADAIRGLVKAGYEIDYQDKRGYTALHAAVLFENITCTSGLLSNGADINIVDSCGKTALDCVLEMESGLEHYFLKHFSVHIFKLQLVDIYISEVNRRIYNANIVNNVNVGSPTAERYCLELKDLKNAKLGSCNVTLLDFLSETGAVAAYPNMPLDMRQTIQKSFAQSDNKLSKQFYEFYGLLQLQRRKALDRMNLVDSAKYSLDLLVGFSIPDLCSTAILRFLPNVDLKNLISSSDDEFPSRKRKRIT